MERTISDMMGKGLVRHNTRAFHAKNVDRERSAENIAFCQERSITGFLMRRWSGIMQSRNGATGRLTITMRRSGGGSRSRPEKWRSWTSGSRSLQ